MGSGDGDSDSHFFVVMLVFTSHFLVSVRGNIIFTPRVLFLDENVEKSLTNFIRLELLIDSGNLCNDGGE